MFSWQIPALHYDLAALAANPASGVVVQAVGGAAATLPLFDSQNQSWGDPLVVTISDLGNYLGGRGGPMQTPRVGPKDAGGGGFIFAAPLLMNVKDLSASIGTVSQLDMCLVNLQYALNEKVYATDLPFFGDRLAQAAGRSSSTRSASRCTTRSRPATTTRPRSSSRRSSTLWHRRGCWWAAWKW